MATTRAGVTDLPETERRRAEAQVEIARSLGSTLELGPLLGEIAQRAATACGMDRCSVFLYRGERLVPVISPLADGRGDPGPEGLERAPFVEQAIESRAPVVIEDVQTDPRVPASLRASKTTRAVALPLVRPDKTVGVLVLAYVDRDRTIRPAQIGVGLTIASQIALAIDAAGLAEVARARARELEILGDLRDSLGSTADLDAVLGAVAESAMRLTGADRSAVFELDDAEGILCPRATVGMSPDGVAPIKVRQGAAGIVTLCRDVMTASDREGRRTALAVPIVAQRTPARAICVSWPSGRTADPSASRLLAALAHQAAVAIENAGLSREAQRTLMELKAKNAELDSFVSTVSHDLKAPLVTIDGLSGLLIEEHAERVPPEVRHYLDRICASVGQMDRLIRDLLALSQIGREARPSERVSLDVVVDDVLRLLRDRIRARGVEVTRTPLGTVWGLRTQLEQVWTNLLGNALLYLGDAAAPRVDIRAENRGDWLECTVQDNGIGIDPVYHEKVFGMFQRLKEVEAEGSGVGLPMVKKIVEAAGGRIWVESTRGQGATFGFTWPTRRPPGR